MLINVLTYNMSWATQVNKELGSEKDFVKACRTKYKRGGKQCTDNAVRKLGKLKQLHLMGIQEVNSAIEKKIRAVQPYLKAHERGKIGRSIVSLMWDPTIFGKKQKSYSFNLSGKEDDRPCLIVLTQKGDETFILINLHSPWVTETLPKILSKEIMNSGIKEIINAFSNEDTKIIVMGDFNDDKALITKEKPLTITLKNKRKLKTKKSKNIRVKLSHNKTKKQLQASLKSCCWHESGHQWGHFTNTGDYILTNNKVKQISMTIPKIFNSKSRDKLLHSDHKPVISMIKI